jgi:hypothetical protein
VTAVTSALPGGARQDKGVRPPLHLRLLRFGRLVRRFWSGLLLSEGRAPGEPKICSPLEGGLGRDGNPPGSAALVRG